MPREIFCFLIFAQRQLICSFSGVRKNEACLLYFLFIWITLARQSERVGVVGTNGGFCRSSLAAGFSPGTSVPSPADIWVSPPGKERLGRFCPRCLEGYSDGSLGLGSKAPSSLGPSSWAWEGAVLGLFEFIPVILLSHGLWLPVHSGRHFGGVGWGVFLVLKINLFPVY